MGAAKKRRNKKYTGLDAKTERASVTHVSVPKRSKLAKWWHENQAKVRSRLILAALAIGLYAIFSWLLGLIF